MKKTVYTLLTGMLLGMMPQRTYAQYASPVGADLTVPQENVYTGQGQGLADAGKTIMLTGASFAMTGLAIFFGGALTYDSDPEFPEMPLYPVFGALGGLTGAALALVGLPIYCIGQTKMYWNDATHFTLGDNTKGSTVIGEVGVGLLGEVSLDVVGGYNFNKYIFLGGGLGLKNYVFFARASENAFEAFPVYANARFSFGSKRVVPYISTSFGYDLTTAEMYTGIEFGSKIRKMDSTKDNSWWLGTKTEFIGDELGFLSIKLGKTF